jgi:hypothetical protein
LANHQRFTIDEVTEDGEPIAPKENVHLFVNQCGVIVRDNIPITTREWNKPKVDGVSYVDQRSKDLLWDTLLSHFNLLPDCKEPIVMSKVKEWDLKKMAEMFRNHKKRLHLDYVAKNKTPEFKGPLEKIKDQWPEFVAYKKSQKAVARSVKNKANAKKKQFHHVTGTGGYKSAVPKWEAMEADIRAKGITLGTEGWPERAKHWWYRHGGSLHPQTGECVHRKKVFKPSEDLVQAMADAHDGKFRPERENDELTRALGNPEHPGRVRGKGAGVSWKKGFSEYDDSYRSRKRKKDQEADRMQTFERMLKD